MEAEWINEAASPDRLLNETLFIRPPEDNNAILIVEGKDDVTFFRNVLENDRYILSPPNLAEISGGNKDKVIETIKKANEEGQKGIIGIIDADFDNLHDVPLDSNVYRTDFHDLEMMLVYSINALIKVLNRYSKLNIITEEYASEIQDIALESSKFVGYALYCSNKNRWMLNFKEFPINKCMNEQCSVDINKVVKCLIIRSKSSEIQEEVASQEILSEMENHSDLWQICRGKEILRVLVHYIKNEIGRQPLSHKDLLEDFLLAFGKEDFRNTNLYEELKAWEDTNKDYSLLSF